MISAIEKIAYHEAGHAMAFMVLKTRFSKVSIVPDDESLGRVTNDLPDSFFDEDLNANRQRSLYEKHILISLAGGLAEMKLTGVENTDGNAVDNSSVVHKCQLKDFDPAIWTTERDEGSWRTLDVGLLKSVNRSMKLLKLTLMISADICFNLLNLRPLLMG